MYLLSVSHLSAFLDVHAIHVFPRGRAAAALVLHKYVGGPHLSNSVDAVLL